MESIVALLNRFHRNIQPKETIYIGWKRPPNGWMKLNNDGTCKGGGEFVGCGSL